MPATRALVAATISLAVSSVRGPTMAAIINRNSGAKLIQTHCRPSSLSGPLSPGPRAGAPPGATPQPRVLAGHRQGLAGVAATQGCAAERWREVRGIRYGR